MTTLPRGSPGWSRLASVDAAELPRLYAYPPDLTRCWVRANMIASVDGGATVDGRAGGLAGPGDRVLFKVMREIADVVLVGAGTVPGGELLRAPS